MKIDEQHLLDALENSLGWRALTIEPMEGATSSLLYKVSAPANVAAVRLFDESRWAESAETLTAREAGILRALTDTTLPVPQLFGTLPHNGVIMSFVPGRVLLPETPPAWWIEHLADTLVQIHHSSCTTQHEYQSWNNVRGQPPPDWWPEPDLWDKAQRALRDPDASPAVFLHRDFHPVNVLWEGRSISGVVDWINACKGPASVDIAHCRCNLAIMYGVPAADAFLRAYRRHDPAFAHAPRWDLDVAFSAMPDVTPYPPWQAFGLPPLTREETRRRLLAFMRAALENAE